MKTGRVVAPTKNVCQRGGQRRGVVGPARGPLTGPNNSPWSEMEDRDDVQFNRPLRPRRGDDSHARDVHGPRHPTRIRRTRDLGRIEVSGANFVSETRQLTGDNAVATLRRVGRGALLKDAFHRLLDADGFSHARSLAYLTSLVAIQALIAIVGIESVLGQGSLSRAIDGAVSQAVPGPAGKILTSAVTHAHQSGAHHHYVALLIGVVGSLFTATTAMAQLERGLNRIYGMDHDRPPVEKYTVAFFSALSAGTLTGVAFVLLAFGDQVFGAKSPAVVTVGWAVVRWPIGIGLITVATTVLFRRSPRRQQPHLSWLAFGSAVAVVVWVLSILGLSLFFRFSSSFGSTYGPLAGIVALLLWSLFSSVSLLYGGAVAAQLESVRTA